MLKFHFQRKVSRLNTLINKNIALKVLEKANILQNIKRVCGASVGSVIAMLFACGYTPAEMKHVMFNSNISKNSTGLLKHFFCFQQLILLSVRLSAKFILKYG